ncbi:hypothetical protein [Dictyobacter formicarum]|uniref:hypothetical protein n=1 Tax=Dictyobacter formicarum TaxID=2778368 RepID=UPI00191563F6|nr:hypothetical protein [Dictyobacter formicarum]
MSPWYGREEFLGEGFFFCQESIDQVQCGLDGAQSPQEASAAEQREEPLQVVKMFAIAKAFVNDPGGLLIGPSEGAVTSSW